MPKERYRLREGMQKGGGPTELYRQLKPVVDDLATCNCVPRSCVCLAEAAYSKPRNRKSALNAPGKSALNAPGKSALNAPGKSLFRSYTKVPLCPLAT